MVGKRLLLFPTIPKRVPRFFVSFQNLLFLPSLLYLGQDAFSNQLFSFLRFGALSFTEESFCQVFLFLCEVGMVNQTVSNIGKVIEISQ